MQDIGSDGTKDTGVWKALPEWVVDRLDSGLFTGFLELQGINISFTESFQDHTNVLYWVFFSSFSNLVAGDRA